MLYIIATPIGNSGDLGARALTLFEELDVLLCEDTKRTGLFLRALGVKNMPKLESFYDEVEEEKVFLALAWLKKGLKVGLVSNGGTPLLSDPGWRLVEKCRREKIGVTSIPGASAVINALVLSGLPMGRFCFLGFLPKKKTARLKILKNYKEIEGSKVVYESPFRLKKLLRDLKDVYGDGLKVAVCREMTKKFEEVTTGLVEEVTVELENRKIKGEVTVVFI
ncbi:16S rRNA (cytidine(1402)-2'-O)-methyltransferase [Patescibacteria group bacterium]|nr:16S rRNA (cytidine(1402)-2'-O)-methyltransferase [Patescibacteria group bacterium]